MEEYSRVDRLASIEAKLDLFIHHLDPRIHHDSLMEQGVFNNGGFWYQDNLVYENRSCMPITPHHMPYQGSSNPTFQDEEELSPIKEQILTYMDENKRMISLHEQKFLDLDAFQVNTNAKLKKIEAQMGHIVQAFKEQFTWTSPSNTSKNPNECMDTPLTNVQELPILKSMEESENEIKIENKALLKNLEDEEPIVDELKVEEESQVMSIENVLVKIDTFTFPMDFVTWDIERDLQNSHILRRPLPSLS